MACTPYLEDIFRCHRKKFNSLKPMNLQATSAHDIYVVEKAVGKMCVTCELPLTLYTKKFISDVLSGGQ